MRTAKQRSNLLNYSNEPSTSVSALSFSNAYLDCHFTGAANLSNLVTNDSPALESFCALDPALERERKLLVFTNEQNELADALARQQQRFNIAPPEPLLRNYPRLREIIATLNTIQNTRKRITQ